MISKWESDEQRLLRWMQITPQKKLEWLHQQHEFNTRHNRKAFRIRKSLRKEQDLLLSSDNVS